MKNLIIDFTLLTFFFSTHSFAALIGDSTVINGTNNGYGHYLNDGLWEAPVISKIEFKITPLEDYSKKCESLKIDFDIYTTSEDWKERIKKKEYERAVKSPVRQRIPRNPLGELEPVYAQFKIEAALDSKGLTSFDIIRAQTTRVNNSAKEKSNLPYFYQEKSTQKFYVESMLKEERIIFKEAKPTYSLMSLTGLLGVEDFEKNDAWVDYDSDKEMGIITVTRMDLVCDILANRGHITSLANSTISLAQENVDTLKEFYDGLFLKMESILKNPKPNERKTLNKDDVYKLGFHVGNYVRQSLHLEDEDAIEKTSLDLRKLLFNGDFKTQMPLFLDRINVSEETHFNLLVHLRISK